MLVSESWFGFGWFCFVSLKQLFSSSFFFFFSCYHCLSPSRSSLFCALLISFKQEKYFCLIDFCQISPLLFKSSPEKTAKSFLLSTWNLRLSTACYTQHPRPANFIITATIQYTVWNVFSCPQKNVPFVHNIKAFLFGSPLPDWFFSHHSNYLNSTTHFPTFFHSHFLNSVDTPCWWRIHHSTMQREWQCLCGYYLHYKYKQLEDRFCISNAFKWELRFCWEEKGC